MPSEDGADGATAVFRAPVYPKEPFMMAVFAESEVCVCAGGWVSGWMCVCVRAHTRVRVMYRCRYADVCVIGVRMLTYA